MLKRLDWSFWKKKGFLIIDLLILGSLIINFLSFNLVDNQIYEVEWAFYAIITFVLALYILFLMDDRIDFLTFLNFLWIYPLCFIFSHLIFSSDVLRKLDYLVAPEIKEFKIEKSNTEFFDLFTLKVQNDTLYFKNLVNKEVNFSKFKVYKSRFQNYYHLIKSE